MSRILLASLLLLLSPGLLADDHLMPLGLGKPFLRDKAGEKWFKSLGKEDRILVEEDTFTAFGSPSFLGIVEAADGKTYNLYYIQDGYDDKQTLLKAPVTAEFANALADKMDHIIRLDTRYDPNENDRVPIIDGDSFLFRSRFAMGEAYAGDDEDLPGQLLRTFQKVLELAKTPVGDDTKRKKLMADILASLDAVKFPAWAITDSMQQKTP